MNLTGFLMLRKFLDSVKEEIDSGCPR